MAKVFTNEVKTGILVIVCLAILISFTISVGKIGIFKKEYKIQAVFSKVGGIEKDSPVRLSGVEVGKVEDVQLVYKKEGDTKVLLTLQLDQNAKIREGSEACVTTLGLMGEKYIELTPGNEGAPFIKAGTTINGKEPLDLEEMVDIAKKIATEVEATLADIRKLTNHLDDTVVANRSNIDGILGNLNRTTANLEEFSDDIKRNPWKLLMKGKEK
jgi:phospholipid/cholesterol/gamma-HCH transport system substrate-binding protein